MAEKKVLNPKTDKPRNKNDLTKEYMLGYLEEYGTAEDVEWYVKLVKSSFFMKVSSLDGKEHSVLDMKKVHDAFAERFFPMLNVKNSNDYMAKVEALLAKKKK